MKNKLTQEDIESAVKKEQYYVFPGTTLTVCCLTLINGYTVTGESACADPDNFDEDLRQQYAYKAAESKIWQLEGYILKDELFKAGAIS